MLQEYLIFRSAVSRFGGMLEQLEAERQRILEKARPPGAPPLRKISATLMTEPVEPETAGSHSPPID